MYFFYAAEPNHHGQNGFIGGLIIGEIGNGSIFHSVDWKSHLSERAVKSSGSAEKVAPGYVL